MFGQRLSLLLLPLCALYLVLAGAAAAQSPAQYQPKMGQPDRDVVWIPSPSEMVGKMLDMARVTPQDYVIDLGSGDAGRTDTGPGIPVSRRHL